MLDPQIHSPSPDRLEQARIFAESLSFIRFRGAGSQQASGLASQGGSGIGEHVDGLLGYGLWKKAAPRLCPQARSRHVGRARRCADGASGCGAERIAQAARRFENLLGADEGSPHPARGTIKSALASRLRTRREDRRSRARYRGRKIRDHDYAVVDKAGSDYAWVAVRPSPDACTRSACTSPLLARP